MAVKLNTSENQSYIIIIVYARKKAKNSVFDVSYGTFDGTELSDLIGLYLLMEMNKSVHLNDQWPEMAVEKDI